MGVIKSNLDQEIITADKKFNVKNCIEIIFENIGSADVTIGLYPLSAGKRVAFKSSSTVLGSPDDFSIKFASTGTKRLYVQTEVAVSSCNCT